MDDRCVGSQPAFAGPETHAAAVGSTGWSRQILEKSSMLAGHPALGFIGKRVEPKLSLGTLVLAALLCDLLWCVFMIVGIEQVRFKPGVAVVAGTRAVAALE